MIIISTFRGTGKVPDIIISIISIIIITFDFAIIKVEKYKTFPSEILTIFQICVIIFPFSYVSHSWCRLLKEEHSKNLFEIRVIRKRSWPIKWEVMRDGRNCIMWSSFVCTPHLILWGNGGRYIQPQKEINTEIW